MAIRVTVTVFVTVAVFVAVTVLVIVMVVVGFRLMVVTIVRMVHGGTAHGQRHASKQQEHSSQHLGSDCERQCCFTARRCSGLYSRRQQRSLETAAKIIFAPSFLV